MLDNCAHGLAFELDVKIMVMKRLTPPVVNIIVKKVLMSGLPVVTFIWVCFQLSFLWCLATSFILLGSWCDHSVRNPGCLVIH